MAVRPQNAVDRRFDLLEKKAEQQVRAQTQQSEQALKRRFASIGSLGSGAAIKAGQQTRQQGGDALARAREGIEAQRTAEDIRRQDVKEGREFATGERVASQEFAGGQAEKGRSFARGERLGGQEFAGQQAQENRAFATGERLGSQEFAGGQAQLGRDLQASQFGQEFGLKLQEFGLNTKVTEANLITAGVELQALIQGEGLTGLAELIFGDPKVQGIFGVGLTPKQLGASISEQGVGTGSIFKDLFKRK